MSALDFKALLRQERQKAAQAAQAAEAAPAVMGAGMPSKAFPWECFRVAPHIDRIYYIPDAITAEEEAKLVQRIAASSPWIQLPNRRVQSLGGVPNPRGMFKEPLPKHVAPVCDMLNRAKVFGGDQATQANHVLLNHYSDGQGIDPHLDGDNFFPRAAILSLAGPAMMEFTNANGSSVAADVLLRPRSLLVFDSHAYTGLRHGIASRTEDIISAKCCNVDARHHVGACVRRAHSRYSITLRHARVAPGEKLMTENQNQEIRRRRLLWEMAIAEKARPQDHRAQR